MKRSMMQTYVNGSDKAVRLYEEAFGARLTASYPNDDGTFFHAELDIEGEILAVSERNSMYAIEGGTETGNVMQFCLEYGEGGEEKVKKAYSTLKEGAKVHFPLAECEYSPLMFDLTDRFGVRWCVFI